MNPFLAEIRIFGCNFAPKGWALCDGQLLSISSNTALFSLLGTYYGGDGRSTFGLPNLQGQAAISQGQGPGLTPYSLGETLGTESVTLNTSQIQAHTHAVNCFDDAGISPLPTGNVLATSGSDSRGNVIYNAATSGTLVNMSMSQIGFTGGSQPHNNMSPYLVLNYCIALQGVFPTRN